MAIRHTPRNEIPQSAPPSCSLPTAAGQPILILFTTAETRCDQSSPRRRRCARQRMVAMFRQRRRKVLDAAVPPVRVPAAEPAREDADPALQRRQGLDVRRDRGREHDREPRVERGSRIRESPPACSTLAPQLTSPCMCAERIGDFRLVRERRVGGPLDDRTELDLCQLLRLVAYGSSIAESRA